MSEDTTLKRYQWNQETNWWKYHQGINQTLYTFHDGTKYQDEKCLSSKETRHRDQISNEDKMHTHEIITLHIYIIQTLVMFKKGKKLQYQFKERCFTQSRIASQRIVHYQEVWLLNVNAQELVHCFSQLKKAQNKFQVEQ